jgi:biopolymer transport protein ExbB
MWPIIASPILAFGIIVERLWSLQRQRVMPKNLVAQVWQLSGQGKRTQNHIERKRDGLPLGRILAAGVINASPHRQLMQESIEESGHRVVPEFERFSNTL